MCYVRRSLVVLEAKCFSTVEDGDCSIGSSQIVWSTFLTNLLDFVTDSCSFMRIYGIKRSILNCF